MKYDQIIQAVCRVCNITPEDLKKRSRSEPLPTARALIAHFLHTELRMTPTDILRITGAPFASRTSIYYYLGRKTLAQQRMPYQKKLRERVGLIQEQLREISDCQELSEKSITVETTV